MEIAEELESLKFSPKSTNPKKSLILVQTTVPSALGIIFTPWMLDKSLMIAAIITFMAILIIWTTLKRSYLSAKRLSFNVVLYIIFIIGILYIKGGV